MRKLTYQTAIHPHDACEAVRRQRATTNPTTARSTVGIANFTAAKTRKNQGGVAPVLQPEVRVQLAHEEEALARGAIADSGAVRPAPQVVPGARRNGEVEDGEGRERDADQEEPAPRRDAPAGCAARPGPGEERHREEEEVVLRGEHRSERERDGDLPAPGVSQRAAPPPRSSPRRTRAARRAASAPRGRPRGRSAGSR